jgi:hypothetical protein
MEKMAVNAVMALPAGILALPWAGPKGDAIPVVLVVVLITLSCSPQELATGLCCHFAGAEMIQNYLIKGYALYFTHAVS